MPNILNHRVMIFSSFGILMGIFISITQTLGAWIFDYYNHINIIQLLSYQVIGGLVGGLIAALSGLSLPSSLIYSLIFCRYFEHVGPILTSNPSQYILFFILTLTMIALLRLFVLSAKIFFNTDLGKIDYISIFITTFIGVSIFIILHYIFLDSLWNKFVINIMR